MDQSNKHSRRLDEELAHQDASFLHGAPVDSRVEPKFQEQDLPRDGSGNRVLDLRSELPSFISGDLFPAFGSEVKARAQEENAPQRLVDLLERLPEEAQFENYEQVMKAIS